MNRFELAIDGTCKVGKPKDVFVSAVEYGDNDFVAEGKRKSDKGLHFEFIKDKDGNYVCEEETALKIINKENND